MKGNAQEREEKGNGNEIAGTKERGKNMKSKEKSGEKNLNIGEASEERRNVPTEGESKIVIEKGKTECEAVAGCRKMEDETTEIMEETENKGGSEATQGKETEVKETPMSLRKFGMEGPGKGWVTAFTSITKEIG